MQHWKARSQLYRSLAEAERMIENLRLIISARPAKVINATFEPWLIISARPAKLINAALEWCFCTMSTCSLNVPICRKLLNMVELALIPHVCCSSNDFLGKGMYIMLLGVRSYSRNYAIAKYGIQNVLVTSCFWPYENRNLLSMKKNRILRWHNEQAKEINCIAITGPLRKHTMTAALQNGARRNLKLNV